MSEALEALLEIESDPELEALARELGEAEEELTQAEEAREAARQRRDKVERQVERLREEASAVEEEAGRDRLVPGSNPSATMARARKEVDDKLQQAEELKQELEGHTEAYREAREERARVAERTVRRLGRHAREALYALVESWALLVTAERPVPEVMRETVLPAEQRWTTTWEALRSVVSKTSTGFSEKKRLRGYLADLDVGSDARLGFLLKDLLDWTRRAKSPAAEVWEEAGVPGLERSILEAEPVPARDAVLRKLEDGRLPFDLNL